MSDSEFDDLYHILKLNYKFKFEGFPSKINLLKSMEVVSRERKQKLQDFLNEVQKFALDMLHKEEKEIKDYFDFIQMAATKK